MKLIWADLETTGLNEKEDDILEVAISIADFHDPFKALPLYHKVLYLPEDCQDTLDPFIINMHTKNGLLVECAKSRALIEQVEEELLQIIPEASNKDERPILAGSTISFDHGFIRQHMPRVAKRLSHRHYDVSTLKLFCQSLGMPKFVKGEAHRAKDDILESIAHGAACLEWLKKNVGAKYNPNVHTH